MNASHKARLLLLNCSVAIAVTTGCTSQQIYGGGQAWQRTECQRIQDFQERKRCMDSAALSYEEYQKQAAAAKAAR